MRRNLSIADITKIAADTRDQHGNNNALSFGHAADHKPAQIKRTIGLKNSR